MSFFDQYKHPNWQKKRLEALEAAGFICQRCENADKQLHVHHKTYVKNRKVWEYAVSELYVLCDSCHAAVHQEKDVLNETLLRSGLVGYMECATLLFGFVGAGALHEDEIEPGLRHFNPSLFLIGEFARNEVDFKEADLRAVLSLDPERFARLAEIARTL